MCQLKLCDGSTMQAVYFELLQIRAKAFPVPKAWTKYLSNWSLPISETLANAQILVGVDCPLLHPHDVVVRGRAVCTNSARLLKSQVTGIYLAFGYTPKKEPLATANAVQTLPRYTIGPVLKKPNHNLCIAICNATPDTT